MRPHVSVRKLRRAAVASVGLVCLAAGLTPLASDVARAEEAPAVAASLPGLVPQPSVVEESGTAPFVIDGSSRIYASAAIRDRADQFGADLRATSGHAVTLVDNPAAADIRIEVDPNAEITVDGAAPGAEVAGEAYLLDVSTDRVQITATDAHGAFNGLQTLRQLLPAWLEGDQLVKTTWQIPTVHIEDVPRFTHRGVMMDVARSFLPPEAVKDQIDTLAKMKLSVLHLHLTDDQGWRIQITNEGREEGDTIDYNKLTDISAHTAMNMVGHRNELGRTGFYTQADYKDIVAYANERFVTVIPEIDLPSHTNAALHAIPQLNTARSLPGRPAGAETVEWNGTGSVGYSALDEQSEATYTFIRHVFKQLQEMTGGPVVHIGGDESHAMGHARYVDFISRVVPEVKEVTGAGVMGWSEYAEAGLNQGPGFWDGSLNHYWVGSGDWVRDFVAKGGKAVVSSAGGAYLDMKYNPTTPIGLTWACSGDCDIPRYYWEPTQIVPGGVPESGIAGVEGPLWSESIRGQDQKEYLMYPRAAALLESGWTAQNRKGLDSFLARIADLGPRLTAGGTNFYETYRATWGAVTAGLDVKLSNGVLRGKAKPAASAAIGTVIAPGTKLNAESTALVVDKANNDGDTASNSVLAEPLTATLTCGAKSYPVRFTADQPRDHLHASGVYIGWVDHPFTAPAQCEVAYSNGDSAPVVVATTVKHAYKPTVTKVTAAPSMTIGDGGTQKMGTWTPMTLAGFQPDVHVQIAVDGVEYYTLRPNAAGEFNSDGLIPRGLYDGIRTFTATQGDTVVSVDVDVDSPLKPLPDLIDQDTLAVADVDSEETAGENGAAANVLDGDAGTYWHTEWSAASPDYPHHITLDLGKQYQVTGFEYVARSGNINGKIKGYRIEVSPDGNTWTQATTGDFIETEMAQTVTFDAVGGRYVRLVATSSLGGGPWAAAAELNVGGTSS